MGGYVHSDPCLTCDAPCQITCMIFMDLLYLTNVFVLTSCELSVFMNPFLNTMFGDKALRTKSPFVSPARPPGE